MTDLTAQEGNSRTPARSDLVGSLAVILAAASWGLSGIFVKSIAQDVEIEALALAFWRDLATFLVLSTGVSLFRPDWLRIKRAHLGWLIALGASLGTFHVFWNLGVFLNGAAVATVQQAAMPAIVAVVAWLLWHEPLTWIKIAAIILTFLGTVLVSGLDLIGGASLSPAGLVAGLAIPVTYAAWSLFGKKVRATYNPITTLTFAFGFGALVLLPFQFFTPQPWPVPASGLLWFAGLIFVATIIPFSTYTFALGRLPASVASILAMSEIAFVAAYAFVLLGERLTINQFLGALLVVGGVLLLSWHRWRERAGKQQGNSSRSAPRRRNSARNERATLGD